MTDNKIKVGIVEAQTFVARELIHLLLNHPGVEISALQAELPKTTSIAEQFGELRGRGELPTLEPYSLERLRTQCHAVFLCTSHGESLRIAPELIGVGIRIFDMSSDFRFRDREAYRRAFRSDHPCPEWNQKAVYGLPELYRPDLFGAPLVAMPGNYPTAVILALAPLMKRELVAKGDVFADCKGGYSTAEHLDRDQTSFCTADGNMFPHFPRSQHQQPEIEEQLRRLSGEHHPVVFVPHLIPVKRGCLATCYVKLGEEMTDETVGKLYRDFYNGRPFVRILPPGAIPELRNVTGTNFCDISLRVERNGRQLIAVAVLDNLLKGAAGQAIQCLNFSYNFDEKTGLM